MQTLPILSQFGRNWLLLLASAALALASGVDAYVNYWRSTDPELILRWRPDDALALIRQHDLTSQDGAGADERIDTTTADTRRALRTEPLTAAALRQLGLAEANRDQIDRAAALMGLAHRVSRHDLPTLLWSAYGSATTGDAVTFLRFTDEALTTSDHAKDVLLPSLAAALTDPAVRDGLISYVKRNRPWIAPLLKIAASSSATAASGAALVIAAGGVPTGADFSEIDAKLLDRLVADHNFAAARAYLRCRAATIDVTSNISTGLIVAGFDPGPFAWAFIDRPEKGALRDESGRIRIHIAPDQSGTVAFRTLALAPGTYRMSYRLDLPNPGRRADIGWEMRCLGPTGDTPLWSWRQADRTTTDPVPSAFAVPTGCLGQSLTLNADSNRSIAESQVVIRDLALSKNGL